MVTKSASSFDKGSSCAQDTDFSKSLPWACMRPRCGFDILVYFSNILLNTKINEKTPDQYHYLHAYRRA
jgi:hypothetical protein